jgi:hypothetical protein
VNTCGHAGPDARKEDCSFSTPRGSGTCNEDSGHEQIPEQHRLRQTVSFHVSDKEAGMVQMFEQSVFHQPQVTSFKKDHSLLLACPAR